MRVTSDTYSRHTATAKARTLDSRAFCKVAVDSPRHSRFQVLVEMETKRGRTILVETYLVGAGPTWTDALAQFHEWHEESSAAAPTGRVKPGTAQRQPKEAGNGLEA